MDFTAELSRHIVRVESGIELCLPGGAQASERLCQAMRYSMQAGGKRLRPVLVLAAAEVFDPQGAVDPLPAAVAVECVHTYSLIHDDLPCMDDDDLRRGRPTLHKAYDEATAVLAGDALLTFAFQLLSTRYAGNSALAAVLVRDLGDAAGFGQLIAGQMLDLLHEGDGAVTSPTLDDIHARKTGAIIGASLAMGGRIGGAPETDVATLRLAGLALGMAFQIVDDILDATSDSATLGKTPGKDREADKTTFVKLHGLDDSRKFARDYTAKAVTALRSLTGNAGDTGFLVALCESMAARIR